MESRKWMDSEGLGKHVGIPLWRTRICRGIDKEAVTGRMGSQDFFQIIRILSSDFYVTMTPDYLSE